MHTEPTKDSKQLSELKNFIRKSLKEEEVNEELLEEGLKELTLAGAIALSSLISTPATSQDTGPNSDEKPKIAHIIKDKLHKGGEKAKELFQQAKESIKNNNVDYESVKVEMQELADSVGGVVGEGESMDPSTARDVARLDAAAQIGSGMQRNGQTYDEKMFVDDKGVYTAIIVYKAELSLREAVKKIVSIELSKNGQNKTQIKEGTLGLLSRDVRSKAQQMLGPNSPLKMREELEDFMVELYKKYGYVLYPIEQSGKQDF